MYREGDSVKVVGYSNKGWFHSYQIGDIGVIISVSTDEDGITGYKVESKLFPFEQWLHPDEFVLINNSNTDKYMENSVLRGDLKYVNNLLEEIITKLHSKEVIEEEKLLEAKQIAHRVNEFYNFKN